jgi:hypothetical protein
MRCSPLVAGESVTRRRRSPQVAVKDNELVACCAIDLGDNNEHKDKEQR